MRQPLSFSQSPPPPPFITTPAANDSSTVFLDLERRDDDGAGVRCGKPPTAAAADDEMTAAVGFESNAEAEIEVEDSTINRISHVSVSRKFSIITRRHGNRSCLPLFSLVMMTSAVVGCCLLFLVLAEPAAVDVLLDLVCVVCGGNGLRRGSPEPLINSSFSPS